MPLQPGLLHCQLAYEPDKTGHLTGLMLSKRAPLLRIRRDSTSLKSTPNPHQIPIFPTNRSIQQLERQTGYRPPHQKLATDGASSELIPTQAECL